MRLTVLGARPCSLVAVFRLQFGLAFIGPDCRTRFDGLLYIGFHLNGDPFYAHPGAPVPAADYQRR
jgi:hypothetical protein